MDQGKAQKGRDAEVRPYILGFWREEAEEDVYFYAVGEIDVF
jgi:hypothetical protein